MMNNLKAEDIQLINEKFSLTTRLDKFIKENVNRNGAINPDNINEGCHDFFLYLRLLLIAAENDGYIEVTKDTIYTNCVDQVRMCLIDISKLGYDSLNIAHIDGVGINCVLTLSISNIAREALNSKWTSARGFFDNYFRGCFGKSLYKLTPVKGVTVTDSLKCYLSYFKTKARLNTSDNKYEGFSKTLDGLVLYKVDDKEYSIYNPHKSEELVHINKNNREALRQFLGERYFREIYKSTPCTIEVMDFGNNGEIHKLTLKNDIDIKSKWYCIGNSSPYQLVDGNLYVLNTDEDILVFSKDNLIEVNYNVSTIRNASMIYEIARTCM